jgi:hypothetical protein
MLMTRLPLSLGMFATLRHGSLLRPRDVALPGSLAVAAMTAAALSLFHPLDASVMILCGNLDGGVDHRAGQPDQPDRSAPDVQCNVSFRERRQARPSATTRAPEQSWSSGRSRCTMPPDGHRAGLRIIDICIVRTALA